jgi:putative oxidoreductase
MLDRILDQWTGAVPVVVRLIAGVTFFMYGYQKLINWGLGRVTTMFTQLGYPLPGVFAVSVTMFELLGGIALVVGFRVRWVAILFGVQMLGALITVHLPHGFFYGPPHHSGISNVLNLFGFALVLSIMGAGPLSVDRFLRRHR